MRPNTCAQHVMRVHFAYSKCAEYHPIALLASHVLAKTSIFVPTRLLVPIITESDLGLHIAPLASLLILVLLRVVPVLELLSFLMGSPYSIVQITTATLPWV